MNWITISDFSEIVQSTSDTGSDYIIFKHSTRCATSSMAKRAFEKEWQGDIPVYLVNVVENRSLSNKIESTFKVRHESPQILLIQKDQCTYNASHHGIDAHELSSIISE